MTKEFNLSEKRKAIKVNMRLALLGASCTNEYMEKCVKAIMDDIEEQDKEFIRLLKEKYLKLGTRVLNNKSDQDVLDLIDKLAWKDLISSKSQKESKK